MLSVIYEICGLSFMVVIAAILMGGVFTGGLLFGLPALPYIKAAFGVALIALMSCIGSGLVAGAINKIGGDK